MDEQELKVTLSTLTLDPTRFTLLVFHLPKHSGRSDYEQLARVLDRVSALRGRYLLLPEDVTVEAYVDAAKEA